MSCWCVRLHPWPTAPSVYLITSLREAWTKYHTTTTEMTGWNCGTLSTSTLTTVTWSSVADCTHKSRFIPCLLKSIYICKIIFANMISLFHIFNVLSELPHYVRAAKFFFLTTTLYTKLCRRLQVCWRSLATLLQIWWWREEGHRAAELDQWDIYQRLPGKEEHRCVQQYWPLRIQNGLKINKIEKKETTVLLLLMFNTWTIT